MKRNRFPRVGGTEHRRADLRIAGVLLLLIVVPTPGARAQASFQGTPGSATGGRILEQSTAFTHITFEQGLSDQRVQALAQDQTGFMWFGTNNGLNRYDGHTIVAYRNDPANPHSIAGNVISALYEDRSGTLWVGSRSGLSAFDRRTERFTNYRHDPADARSLSNNFVLAIHEDRSGTLWVGTSGGLNRFDRAAGIFTAYRHDPADPRSLSDDSVRAIVEDRRGALWFGTMRGLNRFDRATGRFTIYRHDPAGPRSLSHDVVWDVHEDRAGRIWVGTDGGGLNRFEEATNDFTRYRHDPGDAHSLSGDRIAYLFEDASSALWITTFGAGLSVLDPARRRFTSYRHDSRFPTSLNSDYLDEIISDRSGLIWIGTHGNGVNVHDPRRSAFTIYQPDAPAAENLVGKSVSAVKEDKDGFLWIGTQDSGLYRFDRRSGRVVHYPPQPTNPERLGHPWVAALEFETPTTLWVGTYGGGLYRLDTASGRFTPYRHDPDDARSLSDDAVTDLRVDRSGVLWVGTRSSGLNRFDAASGTFTVFRHNPANPGTLGSDWTRSIAEDPDGSLWIGLPDGGLNRLDPGTGTITRYEHDPDDPTSLSDNSVATLHIDRSGELWIGTFSGGLNRFDRTRRIFVHYRERDGLASSRIVSILEDGLSGEAAGNLWMATGHGLSRLDRDRKIFATYDTTHGLPPTEYSHGGHTTRRGELLVGSSDGLIVFDPAAVVSDENVPPVIFTNFLLANKPVPIGDRSPLQQAIDQTSSITLTYADRVISFEFAALNYRGPRQTRYRYRLEGFDDEWIEAGSTQRLVTYTNLAPGKYVFRVTAANADLVWNETGRAIALVVTPPWWSTWWFRGLAIVLVAGSAAGLYARRINGLERRRRALEVEIAERKRVEETLRENNRQIQDLAGRLITAQEVERRRIARELHDDVNQQLAALSVSLGLLKRAPSSDVLPGNELAGLQQRAIEVSEAIRHLSHELHPALLQHAGLVAALRGHCAEFGGLHKIDVIFHADDGLETIPRDEALCLYRIAQEALRNTARYAEARRVHVSLTRQDAIVELRIADDGRGFDLEEARRRGGLGLISIDERVRLVGGQVLIASERGHGTVIEARVPLRLSERVSRRVGEPSQRVAQG
jgi:ligand-binding sensor domain-containing protein/signal transduction histidine kinase